MGLYDCKMIVDWLLIPPHVAFRPMSFVNDELIDETPRDPGQGLKALPSATDTHTMRPHCCVSPSLSHARSVRMRCGMLAPRMLLSLFLSLSSCSPGAAEGEAKAIDEGSMATARALCVDSRIR